MESDLFPFQKFILLYTSQLYLECYSMQNFSQFLGWYLLNQDLTKLSEVN